MPLGARVPELAEKIVLRTFQQCADTLFGIGIDRIFGGVAEDFPRFFVTATDLQGDGFGVKGVVGQRLAAVFSTKIYGQSLYLVDVAQA